MPGDQDTQPSTNLAKYQTSNPVVSRLIDRFFVTLRELVGPLHPGSVLDAGAGEGEGLERLTGSFGDARIVAVDLDPTCVNTIRDRLPEVEASRQSVYELGLADDEVELAMCLEVVEHLEAPERALAELARVSSRHIVVSVPHEPYFRIGSLLRGKYVRSFGNHPEHINHFNHRSLRRLLQSQPLEVLEVRSAFPWLLALCETSPPAAPPRPPD